MRNRSGENEFPAKLQEELIELASDVCNERISETGIQRLEELLNSNSSAQQIYNQYMMMNAELFWLESAMTGNSTASTANSPSTSSSSDDHRKPVGGTGRNWSWLISMAAVLVVGLTFGLLIAGIWPTGNSEIAGNRKPERRTDKVASISGSLNCLWKTGISDSSIGFGSPLYAGQQLELVEGVAEITFQSGARMILQAPAVLDVSSYSESVLHHGRLTATCPPGAEGFRISTAGLLLIDRGTEFGVMTDDEGNTEVHVFDGLVEGQYRETIGGNLRKVQWRTNETVRYDHAKSEISDLDEPKSTFVRTLAPSLGPMNGILSSEDFDYPVGPLGGQNGGFGWGGPWQDMLAEENKPDSNAVAAGSLGDGLLSSSGNHAVLNGHFNRIRRVLSTSFGGVFDTAGIVEDQDGARLLGRNGTTLYLSFSQKVDRLNQVFYGFELNRGDGNRNRVVCIGHGAARSWTDGIVRTPDKEAGVTGWAVTSEFNGADGALLELGSLGDESIDVVLVVAKITFGPNNADKIEVFTNPASMWDEDKCTPRVVGHGNFAFDRIGLANFEGNKKYEVDHIRIGTSFSAVTRPLWKSNPVAKAGLRTSDNQ